MLALMDTLRRTQAAALRALGSGPDEHPYTVAASGRRWRLRDYADSCAGAPLLIVAAPIKRPYIWDLAPSASAVRYCLRHGLHVYLLEWIPPGDNDGNAGLDEYANHGIAAAVAAASDARPGTKPFLIGHSLGGTFAAIFSAQHPRSIRGLVLLSAPLCFRPGSSRFRDAIAFVPPSILREAGVVPGSLLSQMSALASPETFVWSKLMDAARGFGDPLASDTHARIEHWMLDEVPLAGRLVREILQWLYREDRFCRGTLPIGDGGVGPSSLRLPVLAVVGSADEVAPMTSVKPFIDALPARDARVIEYPPEIGVGVQHLGILAGRKVYARVWPEIISWLEARR